LRLSHHKHFNFTELMQAIQTTGLLASRSCFSSKTVAECDHFDGEVLWHPIRVKSTDTAVRNIKAGTHCLGNDSIHVVTSKGELCCAD
jgi:hypothetical protein